MRSAVRTGALIRGIGSAAFATSGKSFASKRLRTVAYLAVSATGRHSSITRRNAGAPRLFPPASSTPSIAPRSKTPAAAARSNVSRNPSSP